MNLIGQLLVTVAIVVVAAGYLIRLAVQAMSGTSGGCHGSCSGCPSLNNANNLVELEFPQNSQRA